MMQVGEDDLKQCEEVVDWFGRQSMQRDVNKTKIIMNKVSLKEVQFKHRHMNEEVSMGRNYGEMGTHIHTFSMKAA